MGTSTTTDPRPTWQRDLEARAAALAGTELDLDRTGEQLLGPLDTWIADAGPTHLLLNPFSLRWLHFDRIHQSWDDTGFRAGHVAFLVADGLLDARELTDAERGAWTLPLAHWRITVERAAGHLGDDEAAEGLAELRWQDPDGTWWSLSPDDAGWLRWNGDTWEPSDPPAHGGA